MPYRKIKLPVPQIGDEPFRGPTYVDLTRFVPGGDIFDIGGKALPFYQHPYNQILVWVVRLYHHY